MSILLSNIWKIWYDRALSGERFTIEIQNTVENITIDHEVQFSPIRTGQDIVGVTCTMHDISSQKQLERSLRESKEAAEDANHTKSLFLANMSHEIRTPMNGIIGLTDLLSETQLSNHQKKYVRQVQGCAESLLNLINDILHLSKIEAGKIEIDTVAFDLPGLIEETVSMLSKGAQDSGLVIQAEIADNVPAVVEGDITRLRQCLTNLIGNAIKFTREGSVTVKISPNPSRKEQVLFEIIDTGIGIPADRIDTIYEMFSQADISTTREFGGTGLGLPITRELIQLMDGELQLESEVGKGSRFYFNLPLPESATSAMRSPDSGLIAGLSWPDERVLVVEDNPVNVIVASGLLKKCHIDVTVANNGLEALATPGARTLLTRAHGLPHARNGWSRSHPHNTPKPRTLP